MLCRRAVWLPVVCLIFCAEAVSAGRPGQLVEVRRADRTRRFELVRELRHPHNGVLSELYLGREKDGDLEVAVKIPRRQSDTFDKEDQILQAVRDPRFPRSFGVGDVRGEDAKRALVLELDRGVQLGKPFQHWQPMEPGRAVRIARQLTLGARALETIGWRHRDVHPANVHIAEGQTSTVRILDLGNASQAGSNINGDVHQIAALLLHSITGNPAVSAETLAQVADPNLRAVLEKALDPDRTKRFATAQSFFEALGPFSHKAASAPYRAVAVEKIGEGGAALALRVNHNSPEYDHLRILKVPKRKTAWGPRDQSERHTVAREIFETARLLGGHPPIRQRFPGILMEAVEVPHTLWLLRDDELLSLPGNSGVLLQAEAIGARYRDLPAKLQGVARGEVGAFADLADAFLSTSPITGQPIRFSRNVHGNYLYDPTSGKITGAFDHISDASRPH